MEEVEFGVDIPEKWVLITAGIVGYGSIILGFWYWSWYGAFCGWVFAKIISKLVFMPYSIGPIWETTDEEE